MQVLIKRVETMGLEPTTPCLQIRPIWTTANGDERLRQIRGTMRTLADGCDWLRLAADVTDLLPRY
jgi:hypothetical protein